MVPQNELWSTKEFDAKYQPVISTKFEFLVKDKIEMQQNGIEAVVKAKSVDVRETHQTRVDTFWVIKKHMGLFPFK